MSCLPNIEFLSYVLQKPSFCIFIAYTEWRFLYLSIIIPPSNICSGTGSIAGFPHSIALAPGIIRISHYRLSNACTYLFTKSNITNSFYPHNDYLCRFMSYAVFSISASPMPDSTLSPDRKRPLRLPLLHKGNSSMCLLWSTDDGRAIIRSVIFRFLTMEQKR